MGPRKRSKPNPKAETELVSQEGPEVQTKDLSNSVTSSSVPSNTLERVEPDHSSVIEPNTVSAKCDQPVQGETDLGLDTIEQKLVWWDMATREQGQSNHPRSEREHFSSWCSFSLSPSSNPRPSHDSSQIPSIIPIKKYRKL